MSSASAGEMNRKASRRSVRNRYRFAAGGGSSRASGGDGAGDRSVSAMSDTNYGGRAENRPAPRVMRLLRRALVEDLLLLGGQLVERRVGLLRTRDRRVDLRRVDVEQLRVLGQVPEVLEARHGLREHLVVRLRVEERR